MTMDIYIGWDHRQPISYHVLAHSIISRASIPVRICPLVVSALPMKRIGLTPFTFTRFMVPWLCNYKGWALFLDIDMLILDDVAKLLPLCDETKTALVSKNKLKFEWASAILFNNAKCQILTPEYVETATKLHGMDWAENVGDLPPEWNHLVGYDSPKKQVSLVHYTQGIPAFSETKDCEYSAEWNKEALAACSSVPWVQLMGNSVHAKPVYERLASARTKRNEAHR